MSKKQPDTNDTVNEIILGEYNEAFPEASPITSDELDQMAFLAQELDKVKSLLPMLYTARGNVIKRSIVTVTAKTFKELSQRITQVASHQGGSIVVRDEGWTTVITPELSDLLRKHNQIDALVLAGWELTSVKQE